MCAVLVLVDPARKADAVLLEIPGPDNPGGCRDLTRVEELPPGWPPPLGKGGGVFRLGRFDFPMQSHTRNASWPTESTVGRRLAIGRPLALKENVAAWEVKGPFGSRVS